MNFGEIKKYDIANGEGVRVSLFVSGCTHHCRGCFNPETWNFEYGEPFTEDTRKVLMDSLAPEYIAGLTLLGGEPFEKENQRALLPFLRKVREMYPDKDIWCYTGYTLEADLLGREGEPGGSPQCESPRCECTDEMLGLIDILVDGEFVEDKKDISLVFRGSSNQRVINLKKTLATGKICLWESKVRNKK